MKMTLNRDAELDAAFHPEIIAIVGASDNPASAGYFFTQYILDYGYPGPVYPVNPQKEYILGLKVYPTLSSIKEPVDYVICCIPAPKIPALLDECYDKGVKFVHVYSGRLSETGQQEDKELEATILQKARKLNIRLIGPNCMGIYCPRGGITYDADFPKEAGKIGFLSQSGGLSTLFVRNGGLRGLRFSKVISYGNALDLDECDFLQYFAYDDETKIVACYIEGVKDARRFIATLNGIAQLKPVIVVKGGRSTIGVKAVASHTASLAGSRVIWETVLKQTGAMQVEDLNELIDMSVAFSFLNPIRGKRVGIGGGGGGPSVLAADICEEKGLTVPPLPPEMEEKLETKAPKLQNWLRNPIDFSIAGGFIDPLELLKVMIDSPSFDFIIVRVNEENPFPKEGWKNSLEPEVEAVITASRNQEKPIIVILGGGKFHLDQFQHWRWKFLAGLQARLVEAHIPTFSTVSEAAKAISKYIDYCAKNGGDRQ